MREDDFHRFAQALDDVSALLGKGITQSPTAKAMFFRALASHSIEAVLAGFDAHTKDPQRGRFMPMPADILAQIEGMVADDGRPGAEEAWALSMRASDESETLVWTDEMAQAWMVCQPVMQMGDEVGARMAFKESYNRQVEDARRARRAVAWTTSLGHDATKRHSALVKAETMGLLGADEALRIAPPEASSDAFALLLETSARRPDGKTVRERIAALKAILTKPEPDYSNAVEQRAKVAERKAAIDEAVKAYQQEPQA